MVLPLNEEYKPKCYLCHKIFNTMLELKLHIIKIHNKSYSNKLNNTQAPGDITIF